MKKMILSVFILITFAFPAFAAETIADAVPAVSSAQNSTGALAFTVTGSGKLIPQAGEVFTQGGNYEGKQLPYLTSTPQPITYPRWALRQGWEGRVSIAIEVRKDGTVGRMKVMQSSGHQILDNAAVKAVHSWKFHPTMKNGQPIVDCVQIPVTFKISEQ